MSWTLQTTQPLVVINYEVKRAAHWQGNYEPNNATYTEM